MSIQKDLMAIGENELRALIDQPVMEDKSTEYKEALSLHNDEAKRKFLAGIASFANASGGDLIYGMKASDGRPLSVQPLGGFNADQTLLALRDLRKR
jgi:predicted HTH transcriptional regulator